MDLPAVNVLRALKASRREPRARGKQDAQRKEPRALRPHPGARPVRCYRESTRRTDRALAIRVAQCDAIENHWSTRRTDRADRAEWSRPVGSPQPAAGTSCAGPPSHCARGDRAQHGARDLGLLTRVMMPECTMRMHNENTQCECMMRAQYAVHCATCSATFIDRTTAGETAILLPPPLPSVGVSTGWRESVSKMTVSSMARPLLQTVKRGWCSAFRTGSTRRARRLLRCRPTRHARPIRRRGCHFADTPCLSALKHLINVTGGAAK